MRVELTKKQITALVFAAEQAHDGSEQCGQPDCSTCGLNKALLKAAKALRKALVNV
jgi:hypothetical protein